MGNYHDHSNCLILNPTSQTPSFLPCLSPSLFPFLKYLLSTYYEQDIVLDSGDTKLRLELRWPCVWVRLEYSVLSFIASFMLPPCSQGIEVHAPSQPSHAATSSTSAAEVLLVRSTHCPGSGSHCCISCLRVFHHYSGWLGLPRAIDLGPFSIPSSLPGPAEFVPHPLGDQDVPWSVITSVILHPNALSFHS